MLVWLTQNLGTVLISLGLLLIVLAVLGKLVRDRRRGKTSCGCNCAHCAMAGSCHAVGKTDGTH